jgi:hypothetical protein
MKARARNWSKPFPIIPERRIVNADRNHLICHAILVGLREFGQDCAVRYTGFTLAHG